jgi:hypothetical protein
VGIWSSKATIRSIHPLRTLCLKWLEIGGWGLLKGECLSSPTNQERRGCDVTVGSEPLELGESWGSSCLACCYGSPASQAGRSWRKVPLSSVEDFSVKCGLGKRGQAEQEHMGDLSPLDWGNPFWTASQSFYVPRFGMSTSLCATWGWFSLCRTGRLGPHYDTHAALISGTH